MVEHTELTVKQVDFESGQGPGSGVLQVSSAVGYYEVQDRQDDR
jgi:hypothetical protein